VLGTELLPEATVISFGASAAKAAPAISAAAVRERAQIRFKFIKKHLP